MRKKGRYCASAALRLQCYAVSFFVYVFSSALLLIANFLRSARNWADCEYVSFLATPFCVIFFQIYVKVIFSALFVFYKLVALYVKMKCTLSIGGDVQLIYFIT